ncbi:replication protein [Streptococcus salivarius]|uniref:replication protein n=1 Tax=Streptococcus salivarius TaxID=1304 RepID=UPI000A091CBA|nr:replication protein [Streptococcus salivarius]ARI57605.1 replication protein [Streptococcus salivarius]MBT0911862.1 replication protein [Streptococcus salivarius]MCA6657168.1 replication protein [Streptococcus salivarius]MCA6658766.1 replication protein [Streptococcus salivarius]
MARNDKNSLTTKQIKFIDAMLTEPTIEKACQKAGVSRATGHKYLKVAAVKKTLRIKQDEMMDKTTQMLYLASSNAVTVLSDIMLNTKVNPFIRTQAAKAILEQSYKTHEIFGVVRQIEELRLEIEEVSKGDQRVTRTKGFIK